MASRVFAVLAVLQWAALWVAAIELDPINDMCVRLYHQSTLKNDTLYILGGLETFINVTSSNQQAGPVTIGYNEYLIEFPMSQSWDWQTNLTESAVNITANPNTGTYPPQVIEGALFQGSPTDSKFYLYGGTTSYYNTSFPGFEGPTDTVYTLWSYDTAAKQWGQYDISAASPVRPSTGAYVEAPDQGLAFYFNGEVDSGSSLATQDLGSDVIVFLDGMLVIDTNNQTAKNVSTDALVNGNPRTRGAMQYIPNYGDQGILVMMGGTSKPITHYDDVSLGTFINMSSIDIFDIASLNDPATPDGVWYTVNATGDIPDPRVDFCLIMQSAPDNSSHNIYLYGGRNDTSYFDQVYVLSIPSFTWTSILQGQSPRYGHTCHLAGDRSMITVGGFSTTDLEYSGCDWERMGVAILDISSMVWGSIFNAEAGEYTVPTAVVAAIGGSTTGGATLTTPSPGYNTEALATLFNSKCTGTLCNSTTTSGTPTPTPTPHHASHAGAIAGGVVGGIAGAALLSTAIFFLCLRRRRNRPADAPPPGTAAEMAHADGMAAGSYYAGSPAGMAPGSSSVEGAESVEPPKELPPTREYHELPAGELVVELPYEAPPRPPSPPRDVKHAYIEMDRG